MMSKWWAWDKIDAVNHAWPAPEHGRQAVVQCSAVHLCTWRRRIDTLLRRQPRMLC